MRKYILLALVLVSLGATAQTRKVFANSVFDLNTFAISYLNSADSVIKVGTGEIGLLKPIRIKGTPAARAADTKVLMYGAGDSAVTGATLSTQYTYPQLSTIGSDASGFTASVSTLYTLADLTGAANATITLPSAASHAGRTIIFWNNSSDATFKWSYAAAITLPDGTTRTTFADGTVDHLISNGSVWVKIN